jgi:Uma2 family endonuclease
MPMSAIPLRKTVHYPDSDGLPMADNDAQLKAMINLLQALEARYSGQPDVYISGNLFIYYVEGNPGLRVAPDAFVVFGVPKGKRRSYRVWEEGRFPAIVFEIASQECWQDLLKKKKDLYERLGIGEYIVFDPDGEFIQPRLQGFRLEQDRYRQIPPEPDGSLVSRATGLRMVAEGENLRLIDAATGERYLWAEEEREARGKEAAARRAAEERAAREAAARRALEEELARLRSELGKREESGG